MRRNFQQMTPDAVRELLSYIPVPQPGTNSRIYWLRIISATCSAVGADNALSLLKEWQEPWEKNAYEKAIRSFRGNYRCTAGTLFYYAKLDEETFWKGGTWNE